MTKYNLSLLEFVCEDCLEIMTTDEDHRFKVNRRVCSEVGLDETIACVMRRINDLQRRRLHTSNVSRKKAMELKIKALKKLLPEGLR